MSQKNIATSTSKFQLDGRPSMKKVVPLGLQHVLAIFIGNIVPMTLVTSVANLSVQDANMLLQCCMLGAAISTVIQLYPIRIGSIQADSGPLCTMGLTYVFLPACLSIAGSKGIPYISGAQTAAGAIATSYRTPLKKMSSFFPPVVTGTIVTTAGVPIFNLTIGNTAGGTSSSDFGTPINQAVGAFVVLVALGFNVFSKGLPKVAAILIGTTAGYILSVIPGLVGFSGIGEATWFAAPKPSAFGVKFDLGYILMSILLCFIVAAQMIGDFSVSRMGGPDREPTPDETGGGAIADGITPIISAVLSSFPTATYSQNSGIMALTKARSRFVALVGCGVLFLVGPCPKVGAVLSTIPNRVTGGGTVVVSAMIVTLGMKLLARVRYSNRNCLIIGVSLALSLGTQFYRGVSTQLPTGIAAMPEENSVIPTSLLVITLNLVFPKDPVVVIEKEGKAQ